MPASRRRTAAAVMCSSPALRAAAARTRFKDWTLPERSTNTSPFSPAATTEPNACRAMAKDFASLDALQAASVSDLISSIEMPVRSA
jgi:hypothetical protein